MTSIFFPDDVSESCTIYVIDEDGIILDEMTYQVEELTLEMNRLSCWHCTGKKFIFFFLFLFICSHRYFLALLHYDVPLPVHFYLADRSGALWNSQQELTLHRGEKLVSQILFLCYEFISLVQFKNLNGRTNIFTVRNKYYWFQK